MSARSRPLIPCAVIVRFHVARSRCTFHVVDAGFAIEPVSALRGAVDTLIVMQILSKHMSLFGAVWCSLLSQYVHMMPSLDTAIVIWRQYLF